MSRRSGAAGVPRLSSGVCILLAAALLLGAPATVLAGTTPTATPNTTNPFSPGIPIPQATTTTPTTASTPSVGQTTTSSSSSSGLSGTDAIVIGIVAAVVLGGIAFFIWHDARHRAPVHSTAGNAEGLPGTATRGSKAPPKTRKLSQAERRRRKRGRAKR